MSRSRTDGRARGGAVGDLAAAVGGALLLVLPAPRGSRQRLRLHHARAAAVADRLADTGTSVLLALAIAAFGAAAIPRLPMFAPRLYLVAIGIGLLTGVPFAAERRSLRRRLRGVEPPPSPLPPRRLSGLLDAETLRVAFDNLAALPPDARAALAALGPVEAGGAPTVAELRLRALATASLGDVRRARAQALRAVQLEPSEWPLLADTGLLLCRAGRFPHGVRLLEAAEARSAHDADARRALAEGLRLAGRLREAVAVIEGRDREGLPRRPARR